MNRKKNSKNTDEKTAASLSHEDVFSFRDAVADVRPLKAEPRIAPVKQTPSPRPRRQLNNEEQADTVLMSDPVSLYDIELSEELFFARSGIQHKVQKKLRRGEFAIEDELDLHGYTVSEAKIAITDFFEDCKKHKLRCIRIIHGKGYRSETKIPILKTHIAYWLPQHKDVMAFASARPQDGGSGALYVLLKVER